MKRKYLRKKVQEVLKKANIPGIGDSVFCSRTIPTSEDELPLILIYTLDISSEILNESPRIYKKDLSMAIEVISQEDSGACLSDEIDEISYLIEKAIEGNTELEEEINDLMLKTVTNTLDGSGSSPIGSSLIRYSFEYLQEERLDVGLPDLKTISTEYKMNGNEDGTTDTIDLT